MSSNPKVSEQLATKRPPHLDMVSKRVPPELYTAVARYLPYQELCKAVHISERWRTTLLAAPFLWTHVRIQLDQDKIKTWVSMIKTMLERGKGLPLTVEVEWWYELKPPVRAFALIFGLISKEMSHIKSLSLAVPSIKGIEEFMEPAPMLEVFQLHLRAHNDFPYLPETIFAGHAPRLRELHLYMADLPRTFTACPALANVTDFSYHWGQEIQDIGLILVMTHLPALKTLTVSTDQAYEIERDMVYLPTVKTLRINHAKGMRDMLRCFPNVSSYVFACPLFRSNEPGVSQTVLRALGSVKKRDSVEIRWTPPHIRLPWLHCKTGLVVVLSGVKVLVDIQPGHLRPALKPEIMAALVKTAHKICVPEELWDLFAKIRLVPRVDLTLLLRPRDDWPEDSPLRAVYDRHEIQSLTIARPFKCKNNTASILPAKLLAQFIQATVVEGGLHKLVLRGFKLDAPDVLGAVPIQYEDDEADINESWNWDVFSIA